jgi:hypothetical protein
LVVCGQTPTVCSERLREYAAKFVPHYLQHFCRNRFSLDSWRDPLGSHVQEVIRDMAHFVAGEGGNPEAVQAAAELLRIPVEQWAD